MNINENRKYVPTFNQFLNEQFLLEFNEYDRNVFKSLNDELTDDNKRNAINRLADLCAPRYEQYPFVIQNINDYDVDYEESLGPWIKQLKIIVKLEQSLQKIGLNVIQKIENADSDYNAKSDLKQIQSLITNIKKAGVVLRKLKYPRISYNGNSDIPDKAEKEVVQNWYSSVINKLKDSKTIERIKAQQSHYGF